MKEHLYTIGEVSKICGISLSALRYYDRVGVIKPEMVDESTGYRYYGKEALMHIPVLRLYQNAGIKLKDIPKMLEQEELQKLGALLSAGAWQVQEEIDTLVMQRDYLSAWSDLVDETVAEMKTEKSKVVMKDFPPGDYFTLKPTPFPGMDFENYLINNELCCGISRKSVAVGPLFIAYPSWEQRCQGSMDDVMLYILKHPDCKMGDNVTPLQSFPCVVCYHRGSYDYIEETY